MRYSPTGKPYRYLRDMRYSPTGNPIDISEIWDIPLKKTLDISEIWDIPLKKTYRYLIYMRYSPTGNPYRYLIYMRYSPTGNPYRYLRDMRYSPTGNPIDISEIWDIPQLGIPEVGSRHILVECKQIELSSIPFSWWYITSTSARVYQGIGYEWREWWFWKICIWKIPYRVLCISEKALFRENNKIIHLKWNVFTNMSIEQ